MTRTLAILAGVALGMLIVSGAGPWRQLFKSPANAAPAPIQRERAPDQRV